MVSSCLFQSSPTPSISYTPTPSAAPPLAYIFEVMSNITLPYAYARLISNSSLVVSTLQISVATAGGVPLKNILLQSISVPPRQQNGNTPVSVFVVVSVLSSLATGGTVSDALLAMTPASLSAVSSAIAVASGGQLASSSVSTQPVPSALVALCQVDPSNTYGYIQCPLPYAKQPTPSARPSQWPAQPVDIGPPIVFGVVSAAIIASVAGLLYVLNRRGHVSNLALAALRKTGVLTMMGAQAEGDDGEYEEDEEDGDFEDDPPPPPPPDNKAPAVTVNALRAYASKSGGGNRRGGEAERDFSGEFPPTTVRNGDNQE